MTFYKVLPAAQCVFCLVLAAVAVGGKRERGINYLFSAFLFSLSVWGFVIFGLRSSRDAATALSWERWTIVLQPVISSLFLHFALLYAPRRDVKVLPLLFYGMAAAFAVLSRTDLVIRGVQIKSFGFAPLLSVPLGPLFMLENLSAYAIALGVFIHARRRSPQADQRNRSAYITVAIVLFLIGGLFDALPALGLPSYPGYIIGTILFCLITTVAIFTQNLLDIREAARKVTTYVFLAALAALPFFGLEIALFSLHPSGLVQSVVSLLLLVAAAVVAPTVSRLLKRRVDRLFYRERYDFLDALQAFSHETPGAGGADEVSAQMAKLIEGALGAARSLLLVVSDHGASETAGSPHPANRQSLEAQSALARWFAGSDRPLPAADLHTIPQLLGLSREEKEILASSGAEMLVPVRAHDGQVIAIFVLGPKRSRRPYTVADLRLVDSLTRQMASRLEAALLYERILHARSRLETWLNTMSDSVVIVGLDLRVQFMNLTAIRAFGSGIGGACEEVFGGDFSFQDLALDTSVQEESWRRQLTRVIRGRHYDAAAASFVNPDGSYSVILVLRDVTERTQAEERLREMERRVIFTSRLASIGEMAAGIAHEVNNPLTSVLGFSQLLLEKDLAPDAREDARMIVEGAKRAASVVERLLAFARQRKRTNKSVDVNTVVRTTLELQSYALRTSNISVVTRFDGDLPRIVADGAQLQQVFLNIIINAEKEMRAAHGRGTLTVRTEADAGKVRISFHDNGRGIPDEIKERIFDPFFTTREGVEGTGLGLSVCHGIVMEHGGRIWAENEQDGGATFTVELPVGAAPAEAPPDGSKEAGEPPLEGARILVVDDEQMIVQFVTHILRRMGCEVEAAGCADEALRMLKEKRYAAVLLDIRMPGMSGIELYGHIEAIASSLAKRTIFITGDVMDDSTQSFLVSSGATAVPKPFTAETLLKALLSVLRRT